VTWPDDPAAFGTRFLLQIEGDVNQSDNEEHHREPAQLDRESFRTYGAQHHKSNDSEDDPKHHARTLAARKHVRLQLPTVTTYD
jgi:hypothetical protein